MINILTSARVTKILLSGASRSCVDLTAGVFRKIRKNIVIIIHFSKTWKSQYFLILFPHFCEISKVYINKHKIYLIALLATPMVPSDSIMSLFVQSTYTNQQWNRFHHSKIDCISHLIDVCIENFCSQYWIWKKVFNHQWTSRRRSSPAFCKDWQNRPWRKPCCRCNAHCWPPVVSRQMDRFVGFSRLLKNHQSYSAIRLNNAAPQDTWYLRDGSLLFPLLQSFSAFPFTDTAYQFNTHSCTIYRNIIQYASLFIQNLTETFANKSSRFRAISGRAIFIEHKAIVISNVLSRWLRMQLIKTILNISQ